MSQPPLHSTFDSIAALAGAVGRGDVDPTVLADDAMRHAQAGNGPGLFADLDAEAGNRETSDAALAGVPIGIEDRLVTRRWRSTGGSRMLAAYQSPFDATAVQDLEQAGCLTVGKLACAEFSMDSASEFALFEATPNPWDAQRQGGSGAAAAVARRLVMGAVGVDTGGSLRAGAALCGVSALRPGQGMVSRLGVIAAASSMDQVTPVARGAGDLAALLDPICHFDPQDATSLEHLNGEANRIGRVRESWQTHRMAQQAQGSRPLKNLRIGILEGDGDGLSAAVADSMEAALQTLESLGAQRVAIALSADGQAATAYHLIAAAEAASNLSRYDGVHFGFRAGRYDDVHDMIGRSRAQGFGQAIIERILLGTRVMSHGHYEALCLPAQRVRRLLAQSLRQALSQSCDLVLRPALPDTAPLLDAQTSLAVRWARDRYLAAASLTGLPALCFPGAPDPDGLPIGMQLIGPDLAEGWLLAVAECFQDVTQWHQREPEQH
ncbi:MAG: amidase family protein [Castellaniella sp.]